MKQTFSLALAALSSIAYALPATQVKRADDGPVGYASQNGGTTGGAGGTTTTVSSLAQFTKAVTADEATVVYVKGTIKGSAQTKVSSDTSILGLDSSSGLEGISLYIKDVSNVIVRNLAISKVLADNGDAIGIQKATNVWIDHMDLSSDMDNGKDYYDGLCDVTHASDWVTISNTYFHDHYKVSLVGHSDSNADEDTGHLTVTYANNYWSNTNSRIPSIRFGTAHIFNSYYDSADTGVNTRMGAEVLVESTVFTGVKYPVCSRDSDETGSAVTKDVDFGSGENTAPKGSLTSMPYKYTLLGSAKVKAAVVGTAGNTLTLG
ncbi:putative pectate lyase A [Fulvia fulva]|uniref:pectate lyase n=1 Tax=Passalora fulva TaxID=5499 RepID=A0A9Q8P9D7_PASFU|nr:putative pectate lyase A [Fulvia fulva]KAK4624122.1 putative pectate lyase A [Fulvia fulva]KAK4625142.1 putative pectate lyase A [Fulvia fulva]UJO17836.1 putative pectate lyase A [Fulvia fulva]WPV14752.1 putative pectate lyase A [Fulvia fulva]WPV30413.1 putative pectate lyase A [Fulvia fulva]